MSRLESIRAGLRADNNPGANLDADAETEEGRDRIRQEARKLVSHAADDQAYEDDGEAYDDDEAYDDGGGYHDGYEDGEYDGEDGEYADERYPPSPSSINQRRKRCRQCYRPASCTRRRLLIAGVVLIGIAVGVAMAVLFVGGGNSTFRIKKLTGKRVGSGQPCAPPDYTRLTWDLDWSASGTLTDTLTDYLSVNIATTRSVQNVYRAFGSSTSLSADGRRMVVAGRFGDTFHLFDRVADSDPTKRRRDDWRLSGVIPIVHQHEIDTLDELKEAKADVVISGDGRTIACGYPYFRTGVAKSGGTREKWGAVVSYRYSEADGKWKQHGQPLYGQGPRDYLGQALALSADGNVLAAGELRHEFRTGMVNIYKMKGTTWIQIGKLPGNVKGEQFGGMVSLSDDGTILAASAMYDGLGSARVYRYEGEFFNAGGGMAWTQIGGPVVGREGYPYFGWPVSLSGDGKRLAASSASFGSDGNIEDNLDRGTVWAFEFDGEKWKQLGGKIEGEYGGDGLGWGLALSKDGQVLAAGAPNSGHFGKKAGYVEIYRYHQDDWLRIGKVIRGERANSRTGVSLSLSSTGKVLAVSSPSDYKKKEGRGKAGDVEMFDAPLDFDCIENGV